MSLREFLTFILIHLRLKVSVEEELESINLSVMFCACPKHVKTLSNTKNRCTQISDIFCINLPGSDCWVVLFMSENEIILKIMKKIKICDAISYSFFVSLFVWNLHVPLWSTYSIIFNLSRFKNINTKWHKVDFRLYILYNEIKELIFTHYLIFSTYIEIVL